MCTVYRAEWRGWAAGVIPLLLLEQDAPQLAFAPHTRSPVQAVLASAVIVIFMLHLRSTVSVLVTLPLSVGGGPPIGALAFNTTRAQREWHDPIVKRLQLVAQGGDVGFFKKGELMPELEKNIVALKPGELSGVIQTSRGFHIVKRVN